MKVVIGDMMSVFDTADHFIVCTSSNLRNESRELIMFNGMAGELEKKFPTLPGIMGKWIFDNHGHAAVYNFRCVGKVGMFQNQILLRLGINLGLISMAAKKLGEFAKANPTKQFHLESPQGKEPWWMVQGPLELHLPDNVTVWRNPE